MLRPEQELPVEIGLLYEIIVSDSDLKKKKQPNNGLEN